MYILFKEVRVKIYFKCGILLIRTNTYYSLAKRCLFIYSSGILRDKTMDRAPIVKKD